MLYTRKGDTGTSGLYCTAERFPKNSSVYDALGTLDELNSLLGVCRAFVTWKKQGDIRIAHEVKGIQECLFIIQAELAGALKSILPGHVKNMERVIARIEAIIEVPHGFIVPGSTRVSALLDYARSVSRRAERAVLDAHSFRTMSPDTLVYLNRLSSLLYALARYAAHLEGKKEASPAY